MHLLTEKLFTGTWRSYKSFHHSGNVKVFNLKSFHEFDFAEDKQLTITQYEDYRARKVLQTNNWSVKLDKKRHYLIIEDHSPLYEVITVNHTALVLMNPATNEKIFFAKKPHWETIVNSSNSTLVL